MKDIFEAQLDMILCAHLVLIYLASISFGEKRSTQSSKNDKYSME